MTTAALAWTDDVDSRTNEYVRRWMRHFPLLRATCIESWLERLEEATVPTRLYRLDAGERDLLVEAHWRSHTGQPPPESPLYDPLTEGLEELVRWAQERSPVSAAFVRTGFRAPIDSEPGLDADLQVDGGTEALHVLESSPRTFDDLCLAQECGYLPAIAVRPFLELEPWQELRAFVRGRRLVGLSQRHPGAKLQGLIGRVDALEEAAQALCTKLAPAWPLEDLVVDLVVDSERSAARIVDLHPWLEWTDPALFRWGEDDFASYAFRYLK